MAKKAGSVTLADIRPGHRCVVREIGRSKGLLRKRIIDMGLTIGPEIYVRKLAPLGDPIEIRLRGYELSLRKEEAKEILVDQL